MNVYDLIKRHEGRRLKPYTDTAGKVTIGYGRNLDDVGISDAEALSMLKQDVERATKVASQYIWWEDLSDIRKAIVVDMIFNLGPGGFRGFVNMRKALKERRYLDAARAMMSSKWATQVPTRAKRLAKMMRENKWPA